MTHPLHFKALIFTFPNSFQTPFFNQLKNLINYIFTISLMGKIGAGKSSFINALFQLLLSPVSDISSCTRQALRFSMTTNRTHTFVDFPNVGENLKWNKEYNQLCRNLLPKLGTQG